jgi:hypothetical protein
MFSLKLLLFQGIVLYLVLINTQSNDNKQSAVS